MPVTLPDWPKEWTKVPGFEFEDIIYEKKYFRNGGVARTTFCHQVGPQLNVARQKCSEELMDAFSDANHDPSIGVVVMTGKGDRAFMAGGDVKEWEPGKGESRFFERGTGDVQSAMARCRKPIIAAVKGYAIANGNHWAYFTDLTIAADNAIFGQNGPRIGSPADGYIVAYLSHVIGAKKAREMWYLCRRYTAQEALEMGLVNTVVPVDKVDEEVDKWCKEILSMVPDCIQVLKASFDSDIDYMRGSMGRLQIKMFPEAFSSPEATEAGQAFGEKRQPDFGKFRGRPEGWTE